MPRRSVKSLEVESFLFDDENERKFAANGVTIEQVDQVLDNPHVVARNRKGRRTRIIVFGTDNGGACIAVPAESTYDERRWRPVTAWPCKDHEKDILRRRLHGN